MDEQIEILNKLTRDTKLAAKNLSPREVIYLVDYYYIMQKDRIRASNQVFSMGDEPHETIRWLMDNTEILERNIKSILNTYGKSKVVGQWCHSIHGIGPVITAGLLSHIDIEKAPYVGHIWSYAGLDPNKKWEKKTKRPWNARLKRLCWIIGECFVKSSGSEKSFYGPLYIQRKIRETERNNNGLNIELARKALQEKNYRDDTIAKKAYESGKLPDAQIHARAKRWTVKIFLAHYHAVAYYDHYKKQPPKPYALDILGHITDIQVPNWPF